MDTISIGKHNPRLADIRKAIDRTLPQEIFTALLLAQQPNYFKRIQELQQINLRI